MALTRGVRHPARRSTCAGGRVVRLEQGDFARESIVLGRSGRGRRVGSSTPAPAGCTWSTSTGRGRARRSTAPSSNRSSAAVGDRPPSRSPAVFEMTHRSGSVLATGAARAVVGTAAIADPAFAGRLVADPWPGRDRRRHRRPRRPRGRTRLGGRRAWRRGDPRSSSVSPTQACATFEVTAIERDGLLGGPDLELYRAPRRPRPGGRSSRRAVSRPSTTCAAVRDAGC